MRKLIYISLVVLCAALALWHFARHATPRSLPQLASGALRQDVYVWQRRRGAELRASISAAAPQVAEFLFLASELSWDNHSLRRVDFPVADCAKKTAGRGVGLALRVGPLPKHATDDDERQMTATCIAAAKNAIESARAGGIEPAEIQIDFDSAESALFAYAGRIAEIRAALAPMRLTFTALPVWLRHPEFADLANAADGYVLQVHSIERPAHVTDTMTLCDPDSAVASVNRAATFGKHFRVALPTYGYDVAFDASGTFRAISAEGPAAWGPDLTIRQLLADSSAMASLINRWSQSRPSQMDGVIWYRLPVASDRLNWSMRTWKSVMAGRAPPRADVRVRVDHPEKGLCEIHLINAGNAECAAAPIVEVSTCESALAIDGVNGFDAAENDHGRVQFAAATSKAIAPGQDLPVGWLRFGTDAEVTGHVVAREQ